METRRRSKRTAVSEAGPFTDTISLDGPPAAKRPKRETSSVFPRYDNADVFVQLDDTILELRLDDLKQRSGWFMHVHRDRLPLGCRIRKDDNTHGDPEASSFSMEWLDNEPHPSPTVTRGANQAREYRKTSRAAKAFFRGLYKLPMEIFAIVEDTVLPESEYPGMSDLESGDVLAQVAKWWADFDCIEEVKEAILQELRIVLIDQRRGFMARASISIVEAADHLRDETMFAEAVIHAAAKGKRLELINDAYSDLDCDLKHCVDMTAFELFQVNVLRAVDRMDECFEKNTFCGFIVEALINRYFCKQGFLNNPESEQAYQCLHRLYHSVDGMEFWDVDMMQRIDMIDYALNANPASRNPLMTVARSQQCQSSQVKVVLSETIERIRGALQPLFADDRNLGYFTCLKFEDTYLEYPWEVRKNRLSGDH
ncbi:hypothetical protein KVT40_000283 [Elsinoe batatas]|uniref:Uncharacterized protein n=1 Tax=Elsinoe batatas TaxID=2601811 RepID=A0A8K0LAN5_9PEZI|nr:hypothetical protein KVT40_000283 [Elsinoe batatas]